MRVQCPEMDVSQEDKEALRPYFEGEFQAALRRVLATANFADSFQRYFSDIPVETWLNGAAEIRSIRDFQHRWVGPAIDSLVRNTMTSLTVSGFETLSRDRCYLFVSNHRDILLDAALVCNESTHHGLETPKVCFGDNLLVRPLIVDLVKMNKGLTVRRGVTARELLHWSMALSEMIRSSIQSNEDSVWIAQREGRAKDGKDLTQAGLVKMLGLAGEGSFLERIKNLHVVPVATSYEYEPCAARKAREVYLTRREGKYEKRPQEDLESMLEGLRCQKGRVHLQIGKELSDEWDTLPDSPRNRQAEGVAHRIDQAILEQFQCWPSHFAAEALLRGVDEPLVGTRQDVSVFVDYMNRELNRLEPSLSKEPELQKCFLELYANPVKQKQALKVF